MINQSNGDGCVAGVKTFVRNRHFYGKLMDVLHFEQEQNYFNEKRWLLNRLVMGYGVVCGLGVEVGQDGASVVVLPGVAIDRWGREVVVPSASPPVALPVLPPGTPQNECDETNCFHLVLCYRECQSDPVPALGGDCDRDVLCSPGSIRERYELSFQPGRVPDVSVDCTVADLVAGSRINYPALAEYVSAPCPSCPDDSCIALANVRVPPAGTKLDAEQINIASRPLVYTADLLHDLLICLTGKASTQDHSRGGKS